MLFRSRQGRTEGRKEGENRFARLVQILMESGRNEELKRVVSDQNYREKMYMEADLL